MDSGGGDHANFRIFRRPVTDRWPSGWVGAEERTLFTKDTKIPGLSAAGAPGSLTFP
jgi:hypothetical protein